MLRLCPDAIAIRKAVLIVMLRREALASGSKGGLASASNTLGRLQEGKSFLVEGLFRKKALNSFVKVGALETMEPSSNPLCTTAIADLYDRKVGKAKPLSKR